MSQADYDKFILRRFCLNVFSSSGRDAMRHFIKGSLHLSSSERMSPATGVLNAVALSVGIWCTIASLWLLFR